MEDKDFGYIKIKKTKEMIDKIERGKRNAILDMNISHYYFKAFEDLDRKEKLRIYDKALSLMEKEGFNLGQTKIIEIQFKAVFCKKAMIELGYDLV